MISVNESRKAYISNILIIKYNKKNKIIIY